jgi:hypothetical protein
MKKNIILSLFLQIVFIVVISWNIIILTGKTVKQASSLGQPQIEPGIEFEGLKESLRNIPVAGFISDKNQSSENNDGRFMMAQYMLAPTVLDLQNTNHQYLILDLSTPQAAEYFLKKFNAKPIAMTVFGKILCLKP